MLNPTTIFSEAFASHLASLYDSAYGRREPRFSNTLYESAKLVFERLSLSDVKTIRSSDIVKVSMSVKEDILRCENRCFQSVAIAQT